MRQKEIIIWLGTDEENRVFGTCTDENRAEENRLSQLELRASLRAPGPWDSKGALMKILTEGLMETPKLENL